MDNRPIGVFDSGLGGLSAVKEMMNLMPNEDVIYFGDTGRVPYGSRSQETLIKYVSQDIRFLKTFDIKMIIIACGTASSAVLPWISDGLDTKILGVVEPASKAAVLASRSNRIGVLGTAATIRYGKYVEYIKKLNPEAEVFQKACPMFVPLVENGYADSEVTKIIAKEYLLDLKDKGIDTIILGCTHYPLLKEVIQDIAGNDVTLIDSGAEASKAAFELLKKENMQSGKEKGSYKYFVSDSPCDFAKFGGIFLQKPMCENIEKIDIEKY